MKKTMKKKVVAGVVTFGLVSGMGMALANTDAGTGLQAWYNSKFNQAAASVESQSTNYANSKVPALANEYNGLKRDATNEIVSTRDIETANSTTEINNAKQSHIDSLNAKEAQIASLMAARFDGISAAANSVINTVGSQAYAYAEQDLGRHTDAQGQQALAKVNQDLTDAKEQAKSELATEIASAKSALEGQLSSETSLTVAEVKAAIDAKIVELRGTITAKKETLVAAQQALIVAKAQELEDNAKTELDAVVSTINN